MPAELRARLGRWETVTVLLLVASILYGISSSPDFWTGSNFNTLTSNVVEVALIALPLTFVIIAAEIDLSVASVLGLASAPLATKAPMTRRPTRMPASVAASGLDPIA